MEPLTDEHLPEDMDTARHGSVTTSPKLEAALEKGMKIARCHRDIVEELRATLDTIQEATEHLEELLQIGRPQS